MPRLCRCGKIVEDRCECFSGASKQLTRSTTTEGHGSDHRKASERYRAEHPLCERCVQLHGVMHAKPSRDMHHIISIRKDSSQRMSRGNWLAVCGEHHEEIDIERMQSETIGFVLPIKVYTSVKQMVLIGN